MRRTGRPAFTLIELLVVVAVISLIAGFLFPVFAHAREKARQAKCLSNLRQLAIGMLMYAEDYDELLPPTIARASSGPLSFPETWVGRLCPYLKSPRVMVDPSSGRRNPDWRVSRDLLGNYGYPPSYRAAGYLGMMTTAPTFGTAMWDGLGGFSGPPLGSYLEEVPSCRTSQVVRQTETILLCDHAVFDWGMAARKIYFPDIRHLRERDRKLPNGATVPQGILNAAFVDGHIRALRHEQFWAILPDYSRLGRPTRSVFRHFWPYE